MKFAYTLLGLGLIVGLLYFGGRKSEPEAPPLAGSELSQDDSYQWLEELESEKALSWVREQNEASLRQLRAHPLFSDLHDQALSIVNDRERLVSVSIRGDYVYNLWQDEDAVRGLWRRMSWDHYLAGVKEWEVVLDIDALGQHEGKSWVFRGSSCLRPAFERCLIYLSDGGKDASVVREFNMRTKEFVADGFQVAEAKSSVSWLDQDRLLITTALFPEFQNESGYGSKVQLWQRGQELEDAPIIFSADQTDVFVRPLVIRDGDEQHVLIRRSRSFFTQELLYYDGEGTKPLELPEHIRMQDFIAGQIIFQLRQDDLGFQSGDVLAVRLDDLRKGDGEASFELLFRPNENQAVSFITRSADRLLVFYLEDVRGRVAKLSPPQDQNQSWQLTPITIGEQGSVRLMSADDETERVLLTYEDFLTPRSILLLKPDHKIKTLASQPERFDASGFIVEQEFATSKDGTRVPYFIVYDPSQLSQGPAPTLLYGYGGFQVSMTPRYLAVRGRLWLERGGVYVLANIRGGGEYGPSWHQAALKVNRQRAYDDFIAVAEDLIERGITQPERLAIEGGSNGGLLVGAVFTQRPELFQAVICQVPLLDMMRYHLLPAGASWVGEYGHPDNPEHAEVLRSYSPFHNIRPDVRYPEVFFVTSTKDDRVHPGHARKMAAKMKDFGHRIYYYENTEGGHSASADLSQRAEKLALEHTYLWKKLAEDMSH